MARPYALDRRWRSVRAVEAGLSRRAAAAKFEVSVGCVVKLMQRWRELGTLEPARIGGAKRSPLAADAERLHALLAAEPDLASAELRSRLAAAGVVTRRAARGRFLLAAGLTRQQRPSTPPSRPAPRSPPRAAPGARSSRP
jgi:transposase